MGTGIGVLLICFLLLAIFGSDSSSENKQDYSAFGMKSNTPGISMPEAKYFTKKNK